MTETPKLHELFLNSTGISINTRTIEKGNMFFALKGENHDAHEYTSEALDKGASSVVVDNPLYLINERCYLVNDTLAALQDLARYHRDQFKGIVIGLTGSNGKTTSKELLNAVLSTRFRTLATQGNLNNHIGVPLTVLRISAETEVAIIEMGANHVGEIALLSSICKPTGGFITNIGKAHIGTFGGFQNIIKGKSEIYDFLVETDGLVWLNTNDPELVKMKGRFKTPMTYPNSDDYLQATLISGDPVITYSAEGRPPVVTRLAGDYNFNNICAALAVGKYLGVDPEKADLAIASYIPENNRSQVQIKGKLTVILDAYNANPSSMEAALRNLAGMKGAIAKSVILGDMYELGEDEESEHRSLGQLTKQLGFTAYFVGKLTKWASEENHDSKHFNTVEELGEYLSEHPIKQGTVLIKGSRGMKMERVYDLL